MSRKSDKHKPNHSAIIANHVKLDRRQQPTKQSPDPEQPDMSKYIAYFIVGTVVLFLIIINLLWN
jgi:hypothetical protein